MYPFFVGKNRIHLAETDSTNNYAYQLIKKQNLPDGTLVTATLQLNGRGQRGNKWLSSAGMNFTGTYIFRPAFLALIHQFWLNKAIAVAVADAIKHFLPELDIRIKWPNDILVNRKKIAGILIESQILGSQISNVIVGIGVNVNQMELPKGTFQATSILLESGKVIDLEDFIQILSEHIENRYLQTKAGNFSKINADYQINLFGRNEKISFEYKSKLIVGTILEVDLDGQIVLKIDGELKRFANGEITLKNL